VTVFTAIPEIGTAATVGLTIVGHQLVSMLVDRFGLLRLPQRPISGLRLTGVALLLGGVSLILMMNTREHHSNKRLFMAQFH
jgi:transporter family-2 protein